jgi:hypothetical protein
MASPRYQTTRPHHAGTASGQGDVLRLLDLGGEDGWQLHLVLKRQPIDNCFAQPLRHPVGVGVWDEFVGRASLGPLS